MALTNAERRKRYYQRNRRKHLDAVAASRRKVAQAIREAKERPCADCGRSFPYYAMDFDHCRGEKTSEVSAATRRGWGLDRTRAEIAKCDVVCAVCHRLRHPPE